MSDLVAFIEARLAEDEQAAQAAARTDDGRGGVWTPPGLQSTYDARVDDHIARHDPARVLRDVEAKRRLLKAHPIEYSKVSDFTDCAACMDVDTYDAYPCLTVRLLALPYADHPDYQAAWAP